MQSACCNVRADRVRADHVLRTGIYAISAALSLSGAISQSATVASLNPRRRRRLGRRLPIAQPSTVDLGPTNQKLDKIADCIGHIVEIANIGACPDPCLRLRCLPLLMKLRARLPTKPKSQAAAIKTEVEKIGEQTKIVSDKFGKIDDVLSKFGVDPETLIQRALDRVNKVKRELGPDAEPDDVVKGLCQGFDQGTDQGRRQRADVRQIGFSRRRNSGRWIGDIRLRCCLEVGQQQTVGNRKHRAEFAGGQGGSGIERTYFRRCRTDQKPDRGKA